MNTNQKLHLQGNQLTIGYVGYYKYMIIFAQKRDETFSVKTLQQSQTCCVIKQRGAQDDGDEVWPKDTEERRGGRAVDAA